MPQVRVLVVDDDADIRAALVSLFEARGFAVAAAADGAEALRCARVQRPDVITLDLQMPVLDGWSFRSMQLQDPALVGIPVVVVSACRDRGGIQAEAFVAKPFNVEELLATVATHARLHRARWGAEGRTK